MHVMWKICNLRESVFLKNLQVLKSIIHNGVELCFGGVAMLHFHDFHSQDTSLKI